MSNALVSIIIPTYNCAAFISEAIESVLGQSYRNFEIIVVDDGSRDNTADVITPYLDRINYIQKPNGGPASARNVGLKHAKGEYIAFLDSDDLWLPAKLEKQIEVMKENPGIGLVACSEFEINPQRVYIGQVLYTNYNDYERFKLSMIKGNGIGGGSTALIHHRCFDKLGGFDENLHGTEDWDMWLRIALNYEVRFVQEPLIQARIRTDSVSSVSNARKMLSNELKVLDKFFADKNYNFSDSFKSKCYAERYFSAARTLKNAGLLKDALRLLFKTAAQYPCMLVRPEFIKVFLVIFVKSFQKLFDISKDK